MMALAWAVITIFGFVCFNMMPNSAHTMTRPYAISLLVAVTIRVRKRATIMIIIAHVSGSIPNPSQFAETRATATLAMAAIVIQPR